MKRIDFLTQTTLLLAALLTGMYVIIDPRFVYAVVLLQFFLGAWQFIGCMVTVRSHHSQYELKKQYLLAASVYLFILTGIFVGSSFIQTPAALLVALFAISWIFCFYYYYVTIRSTFHGDRGHFLPHSGF
jgi:hypothetical protein